MLTIGNIRVGGFPVLMAPMEDISDPPFRRICKRFGADIVYTEFISADGLIRDAAKSLKKLEFREEERPVGIQIFGNSVESMVSAARVATQANPDLIDLNFGCPVRKVAMKGGGAGLLNDIPKMIEIARAVVLSTHLPVTAKTRLGWDENHKEIGEISLRLQDAGISAITIHGRTRSQLYHGRADWTLIGKVKSNPLIHIPVIGNGDITSGPVAIDRQKQTGVDGIMVGRAMIGNPWIFRQIKTFAATGTVPPEPPLGERVDICREHLDASAGWKGEKVALFEMRKHYGHYFKGFPGAKEFRSALVKAASLAEVHNHLDNAGDYIPEYLPG